MAPSSSSAKTLQQNRPRPTISKAIVPAIPLPYIQKRKLQQAAREKANAEAVQATQATVEETPISPRPPKIDNAPSVVNGSSDGHVAERLRGNNESAEVKLAKVPVVTQDVADKSANGGGEGFVEEETMGKQECFT